MSANGRLKLAAQGLGGLIAGLSLTALSGCYPMYPYQQPGHWGPPGQPVYQGQPVRQSTYIMPGDLASPPPTTLGSPAPASAAPATQYETRSPEGAVPDPREPSAKVEPTGAKTSAINAPVGTFGLPTGSQSRLAVTELPEMTAVSPEGFEKPIVRRDGSAVSEKSVVAVSHEEGTTGQPTHDSAYRWFRGYVDYDPQDRSWHLLYDLNPALTDQLGGDITLDGAHGLKPSDAGAMVKVHGVFDSVHADSLGKAIYRVSRIERIAAPQ